MTPVLSPEKPRKLVLRKETLNAIANRGPIVSEDESWQTPCFTKCDTCYTSDVTDVQHHCCCQNPSWATEEI